MAEPCCIGTDVAGITCCSGECCCETCTYEREHADEDTGVVRLDDGSDYDLELADRRLCDARGK